MKFKVVALFAISLMLLFLIGCSGNPDDKKLIGDWYFSSAMYGSEHLDHTYGHIWISKDGTAQCTLICEDKKSGTKSANESCSLSYQEDYSKELECSVYSLEGESFYGFLAVDESQIILMVPMDSGDLSAVLAPYDKSEFVGDWILSSAIISKGEKLFAYTADSYEQTTGGSRTDNMLVFSDDGSCAEYYSKNGVSLNVAKYWDYSDSGIVLHDGNGHSVVAEYQKRDSEQTLFIQGDFTTIIYDKSAG